MKVAAVVVVVAVSLCLAERAVAQDVFRKFRSVAATLKSYVEYSHRQRRDAQVSQQCLDALTQTSTDAFQDCYHIFGIFQGGFEQPTQKNVTDFCDKSCSSLMLKILDAINTECADPNVPNPPGLPTQEQHFLDDACYKSPDGPNCLNQVFTLQSKPPSDGQACITQFESDGQCNDYCTKLLTYFKSSLGCCTELLDLIFDSQVVGEIKTLWTMCNMDKPSGCGSQ